MRRHLVKVKWASYAVIAVSLLVLLRALPLDAAASALRLWVEGLGVWGPVVFGLMYVVAVVAMVPASLLTLAGGAAFGLLTGTITVSLASTAGAAIALLIARYLARRRIEKIAGERPKFAAIDRAIVQGGWKVVALLRLSPVIPFNVQNYLYGLTSIGFWTCVLTSWIAMLPGTFLYVYLGHAAGSVTAGRGRKSAGEWALLGVGLLATVAVTVFITRLARKKLREQPAIDESAPSAAPSSDERDTGRDSRAQRRPSFVRVALPATLAVVLAGAAVVAHLRPELVSSSFGALSLGPPQVELHEEYAERPDGPSFDHSVFKELLQRHVDENGWVDYDALQRDATRLDEYLRALADAPFEELGRDEKLALLINAYNAFTLRLVLDHWPLSSIKNITAAQRWAAVRWQVGAHTWSLNQIEHEQIRARFEEPRIHFALVCAAVGCPPLAREAYSAERLEAQLQHQAEYVHAHETWFQFDRARNLVRLTALYDWYRSDFEQTAPSVLRYASRYSPPLDDALDRGADPKVVFVPYDWTINDVSHRRPR